MIKRTKRSLLIALSMLISTMVFSGPGDLFAITGTGTVATLDIQLCLNGNTPWSCEKHTVTRETLSIRTTVPNHTYPAIGIKILTPGYTLTGCQMISNGYCLFSASNTAATTITVSSTASATLTVTPSTLALSVTGITTTTGNDSGTPRVFTVENTGPGTVTGFECPTSASPSINDIVCSNGCDNLASGSNDCTITITPTATPSATVGNANPTPITLTIAGSNTNTLSPTVNVLTYGSFYQAGWLFSIIETANTSLSIGGTVASESDNAIQDTTKYSLNIGDTTPAMYSGTDGLANTNAMVAAYGAGDYSATVCTSYARDGYENWYLPAICQMGFGGQDDNFNCGVTPGNILNMQYNLLVTNPAQNFNFVNNGFYWSSTASEQLAPTVAWLQQFAVGGGDGGQGGLNGVGTPLGIRCVRDIT